jgi:hypothetical protein
LTKGKGPTGRHDRQDPRELSIRYPFSAALYLGASPAPLQVLRTFDGDRALEKALHGMFDHLRISGEWFEPAPDLLAFLADPNPEMPPTPAPVETTPPDDLLAAIHDVLRERGISLRELGRLADVDDGQLARFLDRERSLTLGTVDRIAEVLGVRLVRERSRRTAAATTRPKAE